MNSLIDLVVNNPLLLVEAALNGLLLGGVLALLALGLNLIFGVLDIVWIVYVDLVMLVMYLVYFLVQVYGWPLWLGALAGVGFGVLLGIAVHLLIITPILGSPPSTSSSPPAASSSSSNRWRRFSSPPTIGPSGSRCRPSNSAACSSRSPGSSRSSRRPVMIGLYVFLTRTYIGTAIRAVSQDRGAMSLMGANPQRIYVTTSAVGARWPGGGGAAEHPVLRAPALRRRVRPDHVHDLCPRRPRQHGRRVHRLVHPQRDHLDRRGGWSTRWATSSRSRCSSCSCSSVPAASSRGGNGQRARRRVSGPRRPRGAALASHRAHAGVRRLRDGPDLHLVLHRPGVVADGTVRPGLARPRRVSRRRRLHDDVALELLRPDALARDIRGDGRGRRPGLGGRLSVLALRDHRPLLRPRHAGRGRGRTPAADRGARLDGRLPRSHAQARGNGREPLPSSSRTSASSTTRRFASGSGALGLVAARPLHGARGHGGDRRGRDGGRVPGIQ